MYKETTTIHEFEDKDGNVTTDTTRETKTYHRSCGEPHYIKIYTNMWCELNEIPIKWRPLFLELAVRMDYADARSEIGGQLVNVIGYTRNAIMRACGWKASSQLSKGLAALTEVGAIRRVCRGQYQINPSYAGKGEWKYDPAKEEGGIENIKVYFDLKNKKVDTQIEWSAPEDEFHGNLSVEHTEIRDADGNDYSSDMEGYVAKSKGA